MRVQQRKGMRVTLMLNHRKPAPNNSSPDPKTHPKQKQKHNFSCVSLFGYIIISIILIFSAIIIITGETPITYSTIRKYIYKTNKVFDLETLSQYDGSDPSKPIYISINGNVYDVSVSPHIYGKGGSYSQFAGRDASRSFVTGCFKTHLTHDIRGFNDDQMKQLNHWAKFYKESQKYFYVGHVELPLINDDDPIPEECKKSE